MSMEASQIAQVLADAARDRKELEPFTASGEMNMASRWEIRRYVTN